MRLGLCCTFLDQPIRFRRTTARYLSTKEPAAQRLFLGELALDNADALAAAVTWCADHGVGAFRVNSQLFPLATHPDVGYALEELPTWQGLARRLEAVRRLAADRDIRLSLHPDQFVVPGSINPATAANSVAELEHQTRVAELIGAEQLTLHGGGAQPTKVDALDRLERSLDLLSPRARSRLVLENDDRSFHVQDLLPLCTRAHIPLVYDVHHHRCLPDALSIEEATDAAAATWGGREPWAHISSPLGGWRRTANPRAHADYIQPSDVPAFWLGRRLTVDVEAKAKEKAVLRLARWLRACTSQQPAQSLS